MFLRRGLAVLAALGMALTAAACGGEAEEDRGLATDSAPRAELAKDEGTVVWYTGSQQEAADAAAAAFREKHGITVKIVRLTSADIGQRFKSEVDAKNVQVDVLSTVDPAFFTDIRQQGWTKVLDATLIDGIAKWPEQFTLDDAAVVIGIGPSTVTWNTEVLKGYSPSTWQDLLDPAIKGEIVLTDPRKSSAWAQLWSVVLRDPGLGEDFIKKFAAQGFRQIVDSSIPGAQLVGAGEGGVLVASTITTQEPLVAQGAPMKQFVLENPAPVYQQYLALPTDAPHPNAGALFAEWLLSEEGQTVYNSAHKQASALGDLEGTVPLPKGVITATPEETAEDMPKILKLLGLE